MIILSSQLKTENRSLGSKCKYNFQRAKDMGFTGGKTGLDFQFSVSTVSQLRGIYFMPMCKK